MIKILNILPKSSLLKLLAVIVLSDGTMYNKKYIRLVTSKDSYCQHELFKLLCLKLYNREPNRCNTRHLSGFTNKMTDYLQSTLNSKKAIADLLRLSPTYKTTRGLATKEQFLSSFQPRAKFLIKEPKKVRWLALRIWFDFDGCIMPSFKLKNKKDKKNEKIYHYYQVQFECEVRIAETNPTLVEDLKQLCLSLGLKAIIKKRSNWSGIEGIVISRLHDVKQFVSNGPVTNIKISGKSKRFQGILKKRICSAVKTILENELIDKSKYFKEENEAIAYRTQMNKFLFSLVR